MAHDLLDATTPMGAKKTTYLELDQGSKVQAEYIWIGGTGHDLRSKTKTLDFIPNSAEELPIWNFDGSSTGQAPGKDSEILLHPRSFFPDPFRKGNNILVMCDCWLPDGVTPAKANHRAAAAEIFNNPAVIAAQPWYGIEQEYTLFNIDGRSPLGWPRGGFPAAQGPYYCGIGADRAFGRNVVESHYRACLYAGIQISGINAEVMPGQWEYQVGPVYGIAAADQLWISRYIMHRVCEEFGIICSFDPKPVPGDWNGAGCHTNYSTAAMRDRGGFQVILEAIKKLEEKHSEHIRVYGEGNERRLTGHHETAPIDKFSYGVANRGASIRIPRDSEKNGCGYFEDRRPASNMDPYIVCSKIAHTTILC